MLNLWRKSLQMWNLDLRHTGFLLVNISALIFNTTTNKNNNNHKLHATLVNCHVAWINI